MTWLAKRVVRWAVKRYGIWNVLNWLEADASDIATWSTDYWGRHG